MAEQDFKKLYEQAINAYNAASAKLTDRDLTNDGQARAEQERAIASILDIGIKSGVMEKLKGAGGALTQTQLDLVTGLAQQTAALGKEAGSAEIGQGVAERNTQRGLVGQESSSIFQMGLQYFSGSTTFLSTFRGLAVLAKAICSSKFVNASSETISKIDDFISNCDEEMLAARGKVPAMNDRAIKRVGTDIDASGAIADVRSSVDSASRQLAGDASEFRGLASAIGRELGSSSVPASTAAAAAPAVKAIAIGKAEDAYERWAKSRGITPNDQVTAAIKSAAGADGSLSEADLQKLHATLQARQIPGFDAAAKVQLETVLKRQMELAPS